MKQKFKDFLSKFSDIKLFKKYNYDVNKVIGVKEKDRYILFADKKLLRIYRDKLKSTPLLCSYIPIENAIFYSFEIESHIIDSVDFDSFVETKVYEEAGLLETEEYIIKYEIVNSLKDEKKSVVQCVIVSLSFIKNNYNYILNESGYIDYLSFPAFAYKSLYSENILKKGNDLFIILRYDKIFFTFYSEGKLTYINTVTGGLEKSFESLSSLKISNFDLDLFKKILIKKGISKNRYKIEEKPVFEKLFGDFKNISKIIEEESLNIVNYFDVENIERIFITTEYGDIPGLNIFLETQLRKKVFGFEFAKDYNLDKLPIDPFLFLAMLETHEAYNFNDLSHNFSIFLRKPTFFYRPSGILILITFIVFTLFMIYPLYLYIDAKIYESKTNKLKNKFYILTSEKNGLEKITNSLENKNRSLFKKIKRLTNKINISKDFIDTIYKFKFGYLPKSQELTEITLLMNKYKIYLNTLDYLQNEYKLNIYSYKSENITKFINSLINSGFNVYFDTIENKNGKYFTVIRIEE